MKIELNRDYNTADTLRALEGKLLMFYGEGMLVVMVNLKIEVIPVTTGKGWFKTTINRTYLTAGDFYGYNNDGEFLGTYSEDKVDSILRMYDLMYLRKRYLKFEKQYLALTKFLKHRNEPVTTNAQ